MAEKWSLAGTYFEACNCDVACPCVFLSAPTTGECQVIIGWHVDKGSYGNVPLDGLNIALYGHSPGNMMKGNWKAAIYLDEKATEAQKNALTQIFAGQAGGHPAVLCSLVSEVLGVKSVSIEYRAEGKKRSLRIPNLAEAEIEAMAGQGNADITIANHPLCAAPGYPVVVSKSKRLTYNDHGVKLDISEKNGFYSPFIYEGP